MAAATATAQCLHKVFVYGTLKRGQPNHHLLENPAKGSVRFLGEARTHDKFPLVIFTEYNIPFLLDAPGQGNHIQGEVYELDDAALEDLDRLENHPEWYLRREETVTVNGREEIVEMYFLPKFKRSLLDLKMYEVFEERMGKEYSLAYEHEVGMDYIRRAVADE